VSISTPNQKSAVKHNVGLVVVVLDEQGRME